MAMSINTNEGAFMALQTLNKTNSQLATVQSRINTGLKVASAKDDGSTFAIAQRLRSDVAGLGAAKNSLDRATSSVDVALAATDAIAGLLIEMKDKATAAADPSLGADSILALQNDIDELVGQIGTIIATADFDGTNLIDGNGDNLSAITSPDGTVGTAISVTGTDLTAATLGVGSLTLAAGSDAEATLINTAIDTVSAAAAVLGSASKRFEISKEFVTKLSDSIEVGIGNLVDADMAKESANLQALQVKQQLGLQALSIANQAPGTVLGLFR